MKLSPFIYGSTVSDHAFANREAERDKLKNNLLQGINTMLISPRRWGKSSLVEKVIQEIRKKEKKVKIVSLDLFSVSSEEEFLELYAREVIKASSTKWEDWVGTGKAFFKQLLPKLSIGVDPNTDFAISFDWSELKKYKEEILNLPERIAEQKEVQYIICLDEFQNLATFTDFEQLEKKLRASWQRHKRVSYCLYGSKQHMMTEIFNNSSKPFYRFGDIIMLGKIRTEKWQKFIVSSFERSGKTITEEDAVFIAKTMKNHSWYVQQLSHYTWQKTARKTNRGQIEEALNELIYANMPLYMRDVEHLSVTQLNLIKAMLSGETQLTSARVMQEYRLGTPRNVAKNRDSLLGADMIHETRHGFELLDPAFEIWFRRQFFR